MLNMKQKSIIALFLSAVLVLTLSAAETVYADYDEEYDEEYDDEYEREHDKDDDRYDDDGDDDDKYEKERKS